MEDRFDQLPFSLRMSHDEMRGRLDLYGSMTLVWIFVGILAAARFTLDRDSHGWKVGDDWRYAGVLTAICALGAIDLFLVMPEGYEDAERSPSLQHLQDCVLAWTGNRLETLVLTPSTLAAAAAIDEPVLRSLREESVTLGGPGFDVALAQART